LPLKNSIWIPGFSRRRCLAQLPTPCHSGFSRRRRCLKLPSPVAYSLPLRIFSSPPLCLQPATVNHQYMHVAFVCSSLAGFVFCALSCTGKQQSERCYEATKLLQIGLAIDGSKQELHQMRGHAFTAEDTNAQGCGSAHGYQKITRDTMRDHTERSEPYVTGTKPRTHVDRELENDKIRAISLPNLGRRRQTFRTLRSLAKALQSETDFAWTQKEVWQWLKQPEQDALKDDPTFAKVFLEALHKHPRDCPL
jgi:hypothetical protein